MSTASDKEGHETETQGTTDTRIQGMCGSTRAALDLPMTSGKRIISRSLALAGWKQHSPTLCRNLHLSYHTPPHRTITTKARTEFVCMAMWHLSCVGPFLWAPQVHFAWRSTRTVLRSAYIPGRLHPLTLPLSYTPTPPSAHACGMYSVQL